ncbi:MAG: single-stranded DNA-binding protein [bacterium]
MFNRVILIGRIASDPKRRLTPSGSVVTNFRLAVSRPVATADGKDADFFTIVAWRDLAERMANAEKGRLVCVEGRLMERSYTPPDGVRRRVVEIVANSIRFLDKPRQVIPPEEYPPDEEIPEDTEEMDENLHIVREEHDEDMT